MGIVVLDLAIKWLAERRLDQPISLVGGLRLNLGHNSGIAFGALTDLPGGVLAAGAAVLILALVIAAGRGLLPVPWPAVGLLVGGALANLFDRLGDGRVTDFIDPPRWPAFNLADMAITCAVLLILWYSIRDERRANKRASTARYRSQPL